MKKLNKYIVLFAAAAMAFASCAKEEIKSAEPETQATPEVYTVRFGANIDDTKVVTPNNDDTAFTSSWNNEDEIGVTTFIQEGTIKEKNVYSIWDNSESAFYAGLSPDCYTEGSDYKYKFKGVYPYPGDGDVIDFGNTRTQNGNNHNAIYDIMISNELESTLPTDNKLILNMNRQTATVYFHLTSVFDEVVKSATLITDEGKPIAAISATLDTEKGFVPTTGNDCNHITLTIDKDGDNVMHSTDMKFWFNVLPVETSTLKLVVETEGHTFTMNKKAATTWAAEQLYATVIEGIPANKWVEKIAEPEPVEVNYSLSSTGWGNQSQHKTLELDENLTVTASDGTNTGKFYTNNNSWRFYANESATATFSLVQGYTFKTAKITYEEDDNGKMTFNGENVDSETELQVDGLSEFSIGATSTSGTKGKVFITNIYVKYVAGSEPFDPLNPSYAITVKSGIQNGTVKAINADSKTITYAKAGDVVTLSAIPETGYALDEGSLKATNSVTGSPIGFTEGTTFTMPAANVNVTAQFSLIPTLFAVSPDAIPGAYVDNNGKGYEIPVTANQAWVAKIKDDDNKAGVTLTTDSGDGQEGDKIVFVFSEKNTSVTEDLSTKIILSPADGGRPDPIELTIIHSKMGASFYVNTDPNEDTKNNLNSNVTAQDEQFVFYITKANFDWDVISIEVNNELAGDDYSAVKTITDEDKRLGYVTVTFPKNVIQGETTDDRSISIKVGLDSQVSGTNRTFTIIQAGTTEVDPSADKINQTITNITGSIYTDFKYSSSTTGAEYSGNCAGSNNSVQLRSDYSSTKPASGIVVTKTAGVVKNVVVKWESHTSSGRILNVYGKNTPYDSVDDLFNTDKDAGTLIGTITNGTSTSVDLTSLANQYLYIGVRSASGAMYLSEISIKYGDMPSKQTLDSPEVSCTGQTSNSLTFEWEEIEHATRYEVSTDGFKWIAPNGTLFHTLTGLSTKSKYTLYVKAIGDDVFYDDSQPSSAEGTTTETGSKIDLLAPSSILVTTKTTALITASWEAPAVTTDVTGYEWIISTANTSVIAESSRIATGTANGLTFTQPGSYTIGTTYYVYARSVGNNDKTNPSDWTSSGSFTVESASFIGRVTTLDKLTDGTYVIVGQQKSNGFGKLTYNSSLNSGRISYTQSFTSVQSSVTTTNNNEKWTVKVTKDDEKTYITIYSVGGSKYIADAGAGKLKWDDTGISYEVTVNDAGVFQLGYSTYYLVVNSSSNYWRNYAASTGYSSGKCIYLYRLGD